jgi:TPR repeat protein
MRSWFRRRPRPDTEISEHRLPLSSTGRPTADSVAELEAAAEQGDVIAMANLGTAMILTGDRAGALHWLGRAWNAGNVGAGFNLGTLHSQAGDTNRAQVIWEQSAALGDPDAMLGLVKQALDRGDPATVERWVPLILAQDAAYPITALGVAFRDRGNVDRAVHAFLRAEELGDAYAMEYRARILDAQGAHDDAVALRARAAKAERMM